MRNRPSDPAIVTSRRLRTTKTIGGGHRQGRITRPFAQTLEMAISNGVSGSA